MAKQRSSPVLKTRASKRSFGRPKKGKQDDSKKIVPSGAEQKEM